MIEAALRALGKRLKVSARGGVAGYLRLIAV